MPDPNTEHVDRNITSPASSSASETPSDFNSIAASELAAATPVETPVSDSAAPAVGQTAPAAAPSQSQLDAGIASHLQTNWGFQPDRLQQFQTPQQVIDYSLQAAYAAQEQLKAREIQYQQQIENLQRQFQQQQAPAQQPAAQVPQPKKTFNKEYLRYLARDPETGRYVAKTPGAINPQIVDEANEYELDRQRRAERLVDEPEAVFEELMASKLEAVREQAKRETIEWFQSQQQVQQQQATVQSILSSNSSWMVQYDAQGQAIMDASGQRPVLTAQGFEYMQRLAEVEQDPELSRLSPAKQDRIAKSMMTRIATPQPTPQQQAASRAQAYTNSNGVDAAMHSQSRNGAGTPVFAGAAMPSADNSFEAIAAREAAEAGIPFSYSQVRTL
jgi:hypothetical protein